jgi:ABC-type lipoprotein export system ATPase subunit
VASITGQQDGTLRIYEEGSNLITCNEVSKVYSNDGLTVKALDEVSVSIEKGDFVLIIGRSGSGKSTLLSVMGGLTRPTKGRIDFDGQDLWKMSDDQLSRLRSHDIGFVFQFPGLLPTLTALENVVLPSMFCDTAADVSARARELLTSLGLKDKFGSFPHQLSGGELKRVSIARALINNPRVILADEPTGDLDAETEQEIMEEFRKVNREGKIIVMVTHNPDLAVYATKVLRMAHGTIGRAKIEE